MKENYTYQVIIDTSDSDCITLRFPQFHEETCVDAGDNPITAAQEYLALQIVDCEDDNRPVPDERAFKDIQLEKDQKLVYVNIWMPYHRSKVQEVYVKKTLTIPAWLDVLAKQNKINFSETLAHALKEKIGVH